MSRSVGSSNDFDRRAAFQRQRDDRALHAWIGLREAGTGLEPSARWATNAVPSVLPLSTMVTSAEKGRDSFR